MIMEMSGDKIQTNMATNGHKFSIDSNNPAAFKVLMDGLYKFAVRAIVRELATNAIDASKQKGLDPMDWTIQLPNASNPMFSIEDKGIGISEKDIYDVYCVLFKSTKSKSNDQTGMFGLGSKTPFAYTRQFVITSACDGMKKTYSAGYGEDDIPFVTKVGEVPSDETGLKVMFAVQQKDFGDFYNAFVMSAIAWPSLPKILGASEFYDYVRRNYYVGNGRDAFEKTVELYHTNKLPEETNRKFFIPINATFCIEMGSVIYAIDDDMLDEASKKIIRESNGNFIIHAPIGSVDITPNREELKYTEKTVKFLNTEITSTFIVGVGAPKEANGWAVNEKFFNSREFNVMLKAQNVNPAAEKVLKETLKVQKTHNSKVHKLAAFFDKNCFFTTWNFWDKRRNETSPFGMISVSCKAGLGQQTKIEQLFLTKANNYGAYIFSEYGQKDISHINIKEDSYIDSAYFVTKIRSFVKDHSSDRYNLKSNGQFIFSKPGLYDFVMADPYYGFTKANSRKTGVFADMKNTYPKKQKVVSGTEPVWHLEMSDNVYNLVKNMYKYDASMNDVNKILQVLPADTKKLYCGRIQSKKILLKDADLRNKKIAFKNLASTNERINFKNLLEKCSNADGNEEDWICISGTTNNLRKYGVWDLGFESAIEYTVNRWDAAANALKPKTVGLQSNSGVWCFESFSWSKAQSFIKNELKPTSVFKQCFDNYSSSSGFDDLKSYYNGLEDSDFKRLNKWVAVPKTTGSTTLKEIEDNFNEAAKNDTSDAVLAQITKAYPMFNLVHNKMKPWTASRGWEYNDDSQGTYCKLFLEYVKTIDN